jgi:hypothetical protein
LEEWCRDPAIPNCSTWGWIRKTLLLGMVCQIEVSCLKNQLYSSKDTFQARVMSWVAMLSVQVYQMQTKTFTKTLTQAKLKSKEQETCLELKKWRKILGK